MTGLGMKRIKGKFRGSDTMDGSGLTALSYLAEGRAAGGGPWETKLSEV